MVLTFDTRLKAIDKATLTPLVESALGSEPIDIMDWRYQPIHGGAGDLGSDMPGVGGIARFAGNACVQRNIVPWSLILKVLPPRAPGDDPYADTRELHVYRSGILDTLPGDVVAPRCFSSVVDPGDAMCLWLEDVCDELDSPWPLSHYRLV